MAGRRPDFERFRNSLAWPIAFTQNATADSPRQFLAPLFLNQWTTKGKGTKAKAAAPKKGNGKVSQLDAAVQVLKANGEAMNCKAMVDAMLEKGLWKTGGKTPAATLYSAILREISTKGSESRFRKTDRGQFTLK